IVASSISSGGGLLRSGDGGTTWALHHGGGFVRQAFYEVVVDTFDSQHLFAGTTDGLYESLDSGKKWDKRRDKRTWSISLDPSTREVLAACADGLFTIGIGGSNWTPVTLPGTPTNGWARLEVRHGPSGEVAYVVGVGYAKPDKKTYDKGHL